MKAAIITGITTIILCIGAYKLAGKIFEEMEKWDKE